MNSTEEFIPSHTPESAEIHPVQHCSGQEHHIVHVAANGTLLPALTYSEGIWGKETNSSFSPDKIPGEEGNNTSERISSMTIPCGLLSDEAVTKCTNVPGVV